MHPACPRFSQKQAQFFARDAVKQDVSLKEPVPSILEARP